MFDSELEFEEFKKLNDIESKNYIANKFYSHIKCIIVSIYKTKYSEDMLQSCWVKFVECNSFIGKLRTANDYIHASKLISRYFCFRYIDMLRNDNDTRCKHKRPTIMSTCKVYGSSNMDIDNYIVNLIAEVRETNIDKSDNIEHIEFIDEFFDLIEFYFPQKIDLIYKIVIDRLSGIKVKDIKSCVTNLLHYYFFDNRDFMKDVKQLLVKYGVTYNIDYRINKKNTCRKRSDR